MPYQRKQLANKRQIGILKAKGTVIQSHKVQTLVQKNEALIQVEFLILKSTVWGMACVVCCEAVKICAFLMTGENAFLIDMGYVYDVAAVGGCWLVLWQL